MIKFLFKIWALTSRYKARFVLAVVTGILSGLGTPVVLVTSAFVFAVVFPNSPMQGPASMLATSQPEPGLTNAPPAQDKLPSLAPTWVTSAKDHWKKQASDYTTALSKRAATSKLTLICVVSLIPLAVLALGIITYLNCYLMNWVAIRALSDLRARLFEHLINQPLSFFNRTSTGDLMSRNNDVGVLQNMIAVSMVTLLKEPISLISTACILFLIHVKLAIISLLIFPLCVIPVAIYGRKVRKSGSAIQSEMAGLGKVMHESFTGNRIIKAYNLEHVVVQQFQEKLKSFISHYMRVVRSTELPGPVMEFLGAIGVAAMFLYLAGGPSPAKFLLFVGSLLSMYSPLKSLTRLHVQLQQAQAATQRVFEILATSSTLRDPPNPVPIKAAGAEIHFDDVSFDYGDKPVLHNIQLRIKPGQMVALVGSSGSGKTTLTNLFLRFYDPTHGAIRIGGVDLREAAVRDLRSQIAVVTQDVILFNDTIRNNIAFGRPGATDAEIEEAARHAYAHDFILEKPKGYQSNIGEKGVNLSGGQRQRLAIARAILKDAPILVLDEATSSLDNESERLVQAALDELMKGRTTICIAHRLSTIQHADVIIVMDNGRIVETGRHAELMIKGGIYHKLHMLQFQKGAALAPAPATA